MSGTRGRVQPPLAPALTLPNDTAAGFAGGVAFFAGSVLATALAGFLVAGLAGEVFATFAFALTGAALLATAFFGADSFVARVARAASSSAFFCSARARFARAA